MSELGLRAVSLAGCGGGLALAWLISTNRRRTPWRLLKIGIAAEFLIAALLLHSPAGTLLFSAARAGVETLRIPAQAGATFVLGEIAAGPFSIVTHVIPMIIFLGSLFGVLYHVGLITSVVRFLARILGRGLGLSGAESLAAAANVFLGMVEAPLCIRPYIERMTRSELFTVMTTGMATVAGSVLVVYAGLLGTEFSGHLVAASLLAAPAAVMMAKIVVPECDTPETGPGTPVELERESAGVVDAAARGAIAGMRLAAGIGATLIAFIALVTLANQFFALLGGWIGIPDLSMQMILGVLFAPMALLLGVPAEDVREIAMLLGTKTVLNEFLAYQELARLIASGAISDRAATLASYALCGFANLGSLAILLGGLGAIAPSRRGELAALGFRSIASGTLATLFAASVVGVLL